MAAGDDALALELDGDVVPVGEVLADGGGADGVVRGEVAEGLVGEDDAPAEGVVGAVALEDDDLVRGVAQLHRDGEVEARRTTADACDPHISLLPLVRFVDGTLAIRRIYFKHEILGLKIFSRLRYS